MNIHDATEQAYKNGYEAGVKEFAEKYCSRFDLTCNYTNGYIIGSVQSVLKELIGNDKERLTMPDDYHFEVGV